MTMTPTSESEAIRCDALALNNSLHQRYTHIYILQTTCFQRQYCVLSPTQSNNHSIMRSSYRPATRHIYRQRLTTNTPTAGKANTSYLVHSFHHIIQLTKQPNKQPTTNQNHPSDQFVAFLYNCCRVCRAAAGVAGGG